MRSTIRLETFSTSFMAEEPAGAKSIYASSMTTSPGNRSTSLSTSPLSSKSPVGALGLTNMATLAPLARSPSTSTSYRLRSGTRVTSAPWDQADV
ncbi:hypothetical protein D3C76_1502860 [compost metagenome]